MQRTENRNAPNLWGWAIAVGVGLVAFGVLLVVGRFEPFPAAALSGGIALVVGLILGMPSRPLPGPVVKAPSPVAKAAVTESVAAPAAFVAPTVSQVPSTAAGPLRLESPRGGKADDLKEIEGIGPAMEKMVNQLGIYHFDQIAAWTDADIAVVDSEMKSFKGRITRDRWVPQAKIIITEGLAAFHERIKTNNY